MAEEEAVGFSTGVKGVHSADMSMFVVSSVHGPRYGAVFLLYQTQFERTLKFYPTSVL